MQRALTTLTGIAPAGDAPIGEDDLHDEGAIERWEGPTATPAMDAASGQARAAGLAVQAAHLSLVPTLTGTYLERFTNATGFTGQSYYYTFFLNLSWRLDLSAIAALRAQSKIAQLARVREERVRLAVRDQIHDAWQRVRAGIVKSRAARAQATAARLAAAYAAERYASGAGTQLDVIQAQRDAFAAEVARIQADADLALARAMLRLSAGRSLEEEHLL